MGTYEGKSSTASLWAILILTVAPTVLSDAMLTSSVEQVCPGKSVTFTCTTNGSSTLAWESDDYIGAGSQFEFRLIDSVGASHSNFDAVATLIARDSTDGELILTSTLRVISRPNTQNVTVSCRNVGLGRINTSTVPLAAVPEAPQNIRAAETPQMVSRNCIILVTWEPPVGILQSDIDHYTVYVSSGSTINGTTAIAFLDEPNCRSNDISIQVTTVTRFGCIGQNSSEIQPILLTTNIQTAPPTEVLDVTPEPVDEPAISAPVIAAIIVVCIIFLVSMTILIIVVLIIFKGRSRKKEEIDSGAEYLKMEEREEDIKLGIQRSLGELYRALKAQTHDQESVKEAVTHLSEYLKKPFASHNTVRKALKNTVKTINRQNGEEFRRALDKLMNSFDISTISGGMKIVIETLHTAAGTDKHEEAIEELRNVLMGWAKSNEIKVCLQKLCDKLLEDESQKRLQEFSEKLEDKSNYENLEDESKLNTTETTIVEDDEAYM